MKYIEAPEYWERQPDEIAVFLAGGITGCPNWQSRMVWQLQNTGYVILNPRRDNFPIHDPGAASEQIRWEFDHLRKADLVSFWFCKETIQPIALFELGAWSRGTDPAVVIGVEEGYVRWLDVFIQMSLLGRNSIAKTLDSLADDIINSEPSLRVRRKQKETK